MDEIDWNWKLTRTQCASLHNGVIFGPVSLPSLAPLRSLRIMDFEMTIRELDEEINVQPAAIADSDFDLLELPISNVPDESLKFELLRVLGLRLIHDRSVSPSRGVTVHGRGVVTVP